VSVEVCILCDTCGRVIDGGKTAKQARAAIREQGGKVALPGDLDICHWCVAEAAATPTGDTAPAPADTTGEAQP
jgi:hypothetical protein